MLLEVGPCIQDLSSCLGQLIQLWQGREGRGYKGKEEVTKQLEVYKYKKSISK